MAEDRESGEDDLGNRADGDITSHSPDNDSGLVCGLLHKDPTNRNGKKTKTVSFHSATSLPTERKINSVTDCLQYMINGSSLLKIRPNARQYHRYFALDEDLAAIRWTPTSKKTTKALLYMNSVREIRTGKNTDVFRNRELSGGYCEDCTFSVIYGESFDTLDLVASTPDEANIWMTGLNALIGASKSPDAFDDRQHLRDRYPFLIESSRWLQEMFDEADRDNSGCLDEQEAIALAKRLNSQLASERIRQKIVEMEHQRVDSHRGRIASREFIDMFKEIATRPEIYFLLIRHASKDFLTVEDVQLFLEGEQGMPGLTPEKCQEIINQYEPSEEARQNGRLLIDGFSQYLLSPESDLFDPAHKMVCQDMKQPLPHYFISSSHNTYLLEDQLKGPSGVEGYIRALQKGCRCIKLDCWDDGDEPVVYRSQSTCSKIVFEEALYTIREYAFCASEYPLILHVENHCNLPNQKYMASYIRMMLGSCLYTDPPGSWGHVTEMSPDDLKGRILLKGKKLPADCLDDNGEITDEDEGSDVINRRKTSARIFLEKKSCQVKARARLCRELSDLISIPRTTFVDFYTLRTKHGCKLEACSISESTAAKLAHACPEQFVNHNKQFLTRIHPNGSRVDSSNYNPLDFWNCGCQMVALNFQTFGQMMDLHDGRFRQNGGCGYVLKPSVMREPVSLFSAHSKGVIPGVLPQVLRLKVISGQQLPRPKGSTAKGESIDPYVMIQIYGIPADCVEVQTRTVSNEGNCPIFDESFEFEINLPELALVRFVVLDDEFIGDDFIGQYTIPFECLQTGYRHLRLVSYCGETIENCTLFVHVAITNKSGGGDHLKVKSNKVHLDIRPVGVKSVDEPLKAVIPCVAEASAMRMSVGCAMTGLRQECGLGEGANVKQCLRVVISRLATETEPVAVNIVECKGFPVIQLSGSVSPRLSKAITLFDKVLQGYKFVIESAEKHLQTLQKTHHLLLECYEDMGALCMQAGVKGKKLNKALENYAWNVRILRGQQDLLESCRKECQHSVKQMLSSVDTNSSFKSKERGSPASHRTMPKLNLRERKHWQDGDGSPFSPTSPLPASPMDNRPRSILKNRVSSCADLLQPTTTTSTDDVFKPAETELPDGSLR